MVKRIEGAKLVKLPQEEEPVCMAIFKDILFIATKEGVYRKLENEDIFVPILFEVKK